MVLFLDVYKVSGFFHADCGETSATSKSVLREKDLNDSTELRRRFDHEPNKPMIERTGAAKVMGCSEKVKV